MTYNVFGGTLNLTLSIYLQTGGVAFGRDKNHTEKWRKSVPLQKLGRNCPCRIGSRSVAVVLHRHVGALHSFM